MFRGSLPVKAQAIVYEAVKDWRGKIQILCSGNFTIEKMLYAAGYREIYSNDVLMYTTAIGRYFTGQNIDIEPKPEVREQFEWIWKYNETNEEKLANILLLSSFAHMLKKENPYYDRMKRQYRKQWDVLHQKMVKKIQDNPVKIKEYYLGDALKVVEKIGRDAGIITFPPFFGAGENFAKDFEQLEELYQWELPEYEEFDEDTLPNFFENVMDRERWVIGTNERIDELEAYLIGLSRTTNRGVPIYLYASGGNTRICMPRQDVEDVLNEKIGPNEDIGEEMTITLLTHNQFYALRSQYMNINIRPGVATQAIGVLVDGKLIGVYAFSTTPTPARWEGKVETPTIYLLSDFPVVPTKYKHMAKLVLYAALSKESKAVAENVANKRIRSMITTAFTNKPVSMKYRGLFELLNRKENTAFEENWGKDISRSNSYYAQKYCINYGTAMGRWTLQEGLELWKKKHGGAVVGN